MKLITVVFLLACGLLGQNPSAPSSGTAPPIPPIPSRPASTIPVPVIYRLFFQHIVAVDAAAAKLDAQSKPGGSDLRGWYQKSIQLSDQDTATLKQNATSCNQAVAAQETKIRAVVDKFHADNPQLPKSGSLPPLPPELDQLVHGRTAISNGCIQNLQSTLSAATFMKVDSFVRARFSQNLTMQIPAAIKSVAGKPLPSSAAPSAGGTK